MENQYVDLVYPQLRKKHKKAQNKTNELILNAINSFIGKETNKFTEQRNIYGEYKITLNKRNLLSIIIESYSYLPGEDTEFNFLNSLNINTRDAYIYNFNDLFSKGSNYDYIINKIILENIKESNIPIIEEFATLNKNKRFYLTEDSLVIYYELNGNSKYASTYCIPQINIAFKSIQDIINPKGPITNLLLKSVY